MNDINAQPHEILGARQEIKEGSSDFVVLDRYLQGITQGNLDQYMGILQAVVRKEVEDSRELKMLPPHFEEDIAARAFALFFSPHKIPKVARNGLEAYIHKKIYDFLVTLLPQIWTAPDDRKNIDLVERTGKEGFGQGIEHIKEAASFVSTLESARHIERREEADRRERMKEAMSKREKRFRELWTKKVGDRFVHHSIMTPSYGRPPGDMLYFIGCNGLLVHDALRDAGRDHIGLNLQGEADIAVLPDDEASWSVEGFGGYGQDPMITFIIDKDSVRDAPKKAGHIGAHPKEQHINGIVPPEAVVGIFVDERYLLEKITSYIKLPEIQKTEIRMADLGDMLRGNDDFALFARGLMHAFYDYPERAIPIYTGMYRDSPYSADDGNDNFDNVVKRRIF